MGCCGQARWKREEVPDHKFDFIDVRDYWSNGYLTRIKYAFLFANMIKSVAVYIADIYTAITLLAFHHFNGSIYNRVANNPENTVRVPFDYGKWIFTGCIIFSFLLLAYEGHKARAVIRSRDISYAYTNVMANDYYSLRSYNHFCFFCQINNSKKKKDEVAFFIFFTFKGWKRLLVADGPRQVINALTLYALAEAANFSTNLQDYYEGNIFTLVMLLTMLFTVLVFAGSAFLLLVAALLYIPLICYIQGNLKEYCCHKIDKRISELVQKKKKQRLGKYAAIARAEAAGDFKHLMNKKGEIVRRKMVQPTLPNLDVDLLETDSKSIRKNLDRTASISSSTANGGMYGAETGMYSLKEGDDYASTAQLMMNQGQAGSTPGHQYQNSIGSNINGAPSLPPTVHNSPDGYPMQVRGMQGVQDVMRTQGLASSQSILAEMGPIGTSPDVFAKRVVGRPDGMRSGKGDGSGDNNDQMSPPLGQGRTKSPLAMQVPPENGYYGDQFRNNYIDQSAPQGQQNEGAAYAYPDAFFPQAGGAGGLEYPPVPAPQHLQQQYLAAAAPPADLSAYAPYQQENHLSPYPAEGDPNHTSRPHSFSDVYEAYYNDYENPDDAVQQQTHGQSANEQYYQHQEQVYGHGWQGQDGRDQRAIQAGHDVHDYSNGYAVASPPYNGYQHQGYT